MFVVLSVPAEEADKVGGNSSCEETMALTENCRCIVVRSTCAQLDLRGRGCVVMGCCPVRGSFSSRYQCGLECVQALHNLLRFAIQLSESAVSYCVLNAQGAPVSQMDMYRCVGTKACVWSHIDTRNSWPFANLYARS